MDDNAVRMGGARTARASALFFIILLVVLHFIEPDYLPTRHTISQYALSSSGYLMRTAFVILGVGLMSLAYSLVVEAPFEMGSKLGAFFLVLAGFSFFSLVFILPDPGDAADSVSGTIHNFSLQMGISMIILGGIVISLRLRNFLAPFPGWTGVGLIVAVWGARIWERGAPDGISGIQQRVGFGLIIIWIIWTASIIVRKESPSR